MCFCIHTFGIFAAVILWNPGGVWLCRYLGSHHQRDLIKRWDGWRLIGLTPLLLIPERGRHDLGKKTITIFTIFTIVITIITTVFK